MTEKFTYVDFLMYVLPGVILSWVVLGTWAVLDLPLPALTGESGVFGSVAFVLMCFIAGHLVQAIAHSAPERVLKRVFWGGHYPSGLLLFHGVGIIATRERERHLQLLEEQGLLSPELRSKFTTTVAIRWFRCRHEGLADEDFKDAVAGSQLAFDRARVAIEESGLGVRARRAEGYYLFYRGGFTAGLVGVGAFGVLALLPSLAEQSVVDGKERWFLLACLALSSLLATAFFWRARGTGQGYAREVLRGFDYLRILHQSESKAVDEPEGDAS